MNTSQPTLLDVTVAVVQETERRVLTFRSAGKVFDGILRIILFPFPFLQIGIGELLRPASTWAIISFVLLAGTTFFIPHAEISAQTKSYIFLFCFYAPIFLVAFAVPSTFAFDSIKGPQIQGLADYIYSLGVDDEAKIESFKDSLSIVAERAHSRVKTFQWLVATIWALFLYGLNQMNNIALKVAPEQISKIISDNLPTLVIYVVVSLLSIIVIVGYKKANDAIFRRIQFAVQELKYRVAVQ